MNRKNLKKQALKCFKRNYLKIILVVFIVNILVNGGYQFTSIISNPNINNQVINNKIVDNGYKITKTITNGNNRSNYEIVNELVDTISNKVSVSGHSSGVMGTLFNQITKSNSIVIGSLNAANLYLLNNKIDILYISLIGIIIILKSKAK